jgi:hypothetical protein
MPKHAAHQMAQQWLQRHKEGERAERLAAQVRTAAGSKWLRLGRMLGLGPRFNTDDL